jgi:hypothetical protein
MTVADHHVDVRQQVGEGADERQQDVRRPMTSDVAVSSAGAEAGTG